MGRAEWEEEEEEKEEEELLLVVLLLVKGVVEGVGVSATFCFFALSFKAPMSHLRTHASSSSGTRRPCGMGAWGWAASKCAATLYNQTVDAHWGQFTGRLVQGMALVAVDIRLQEMV